MNYLALVNSAREKCRISGSALTSVTGQTGDNLKFCNMINEAWIDIQERHDNWNFMRTSFSFATINQQQQYTPTQAGVTNLGNWKRDSFRIYVNSIGYPSEIYMPCLEYEEFRNLYQFGAMRTNYARPVLFAVDPSKNILLGPGPNAAGYTILGNYYTVPAELSAATDIPSLPTQFHRTIVYRAMMYYGASEAATEVYDEGKIEFKNFLANLEVDQLPEIDLGGSLA